MDIWLYKTLVQQYVISRVVILKKLLNLDCCEFGDVKIYGAVESIYINYQSHPNDNMNDRMITINNRNKKNSKVYLFILKLVLIFKKLSKCLQICLFIMIYFHPNNYIGFWLSKCLRMHFFHPKNCICIKELFFNLKMCFSLYKLRQKI